MWAQALRTMPRVGMAEWRLLDPIARWLITSRASVLLMTLSACALGGLLALRDGHFHTLHFVLCMLGLLLAHATNNQLNDFTDSLRGVDKHNYARNRYGTHVLEHGLMSQRALLLTIALTGGLALLIGLYLASHTGELTAWFMAAGAVFLLFYTWPLKVIGLGEVAVLLVWGPLMVVGSYYVCSAQWSWPVVAISLLYGLGPSCVIFGKHTDKASADRKLGIRSLPVLLGEQLSRQCIIAMLWAQYLLAAALLLSGQFGWPLALVFIQLPGAIKAAKQIRAPRPEQRPADFPEEIWPLWLSAHAFQHTRRFGGLLMAACLIEWLRVV